MNNLETILSYYDYCAYALFMMIGLYAMIAKNNLVKKIIGMAIFQAAIILFYVSSGYKTGATIPILAHDSHHAETHHEPIEASHSTTTAEPGHPSSSQFSLVQSNDSQYDNPLPHVLMLTAIVVGVATLGVALSLIQQINAEYGTIEDDEILEQLQK